MTEKVYVIGTAYDAPVKIGCSRDLSRRLARIQLLSPVELAVLHVIETPAPYQLEAHLHDVFADYRVRGEWFRIPDLSVALIDNAVAAFEAPTRRQQPRDPYTAAAMIAARALINSYKQSRGLNVAQAAAAIAVDHGLSTQLMWKLQYRPFVAILAADYAAIWAAAAPLFPELNVQHFMPTAQMIVEASSDRLPNEPIEHEEHDNDRQA